MKIQDVVNLSIKDPKNERQWLQITEEQLQLRVNGAGRLLFEVVGSSEAISQLYTELNELIQAASEDAKGKNQ